MAYDILHFDGGSLPVSSTNPYGAIQDGATVINSKTMNDIEVLFQYLMAFGSITPNNLPDNTPNGFQLRQALNNWGANLIGPNTSDIATLNTELALGCIIFPG